MSGTSTHAARIRMATASYAAATYPVGAVVALDIVCNNLDHYCDSFGQVRAGFSAVAAALAPKAAYLTPRTTSVVANTWYPIAATAEFPIPIRASGAPYIMLVRMGGASSDNSTAVKFACVLAPVFEAAAVLAASSSDASFETATRTANTAAWMTGASQGAIGYTTAVALSASEAARYLRVTSTPVDLAGDDAAVAQCMVSLVVYGSTANTASVPRLYGFHAREFVG